MGTFLHFCLQLQVDAMLIIEQSDFSMILFEYFPKMFIPLILLDKILPFCPYVTNSCDQYRRRIKRRTTLLLRFVRSAQ